MSVNNNHPEVNSSLIISVLREQGQQFLWLSCPEAYIDPLSQSQMWHVFPPLDPHLWNATTIPSSMLSRSLDYFSGRTKHGAQSHNIQNFPRSVWNPPGSFLGAEMRVRCSVVLCLLVCSAECYTTTLVNISVMWLAVPQCLFITAQYKHGKMAPRAWGCAFLRWGKETQIKGGWGGSGLYTKPSLKPCAYTYIFSIFMWISKPCWSITCVAIVYFPQVFFFS